jgi:carbon-monoxide dehydrogenase small subunit
MKTLIQSTLNGEAWFLCEPRQSLLEVLRETLGYTGTKEACNNGNCGACSVILDGVLVNACLVLAVEPRKAIRTIEALLCPAGCIRSGKISETRCTAMRHCRSFIVAATALLGDTSSEQEVRAGGR